MSLFNYLVIAIALSMDTFSLSLGLSLLLNNNTIKIFPIIVGILHFILPFIGTILGINLLRIIPIEPNKLLGYIFLFLFIKLLKDIFYDKDNNININIINIFLLAFLVSIDSLITGIGLSTAITNLLPFTVFSIVSFLFTYLGLKIGYFAKKELGSIANIIGLILLLSLSIIHLCK